MLMKAVDKTTWQQIKVGRAIAEVKLEPGQFVFGRNSASKELGMKPTTIRKRIIKLKNMQNCDIKSDTHYSIISITKWGVYQDPKNKSDSKSVNQVSTKCQPSDTPKAVKNKKKTTPPMVIYPPWLDMELWQEYKKHRVKKKALMTDYAEKLAIDKLEKIMKQGYSQNEIINNVILRGWIGIFAPVDRYNKPKARAAPTALPFPKRNPIEEAQAIKETKARLAKLTVGIKEMPS